MQRIRKSPEFSDFLFVVGFVSLFEPLIGLNVFLRYLLIIDHFFPANLQGRV